MDSFLPPWIVTAGLVGVVVALVVATAQQNWRPRVFFLLALRIAIGWQFLSEGLNKIQSHVIGASEPGKTFSPDLAKPFSSEPYFRESEGPLAGLMRSMYLDDPDKTLVDLVRPATDPKTVGDLLGADGLAAVKADLARPGPALLLARVYAPKAPGDMAPADAADTYAKGLAALPLNGPGGQFLAAYPATVGGADDPATAGAAEIDAKILAQLPAEAEAALTARSALVEGAINAARNTPADGVRKDAKGNEFTGPISDEEAAKRRAAVANLLPAYRRTFARWSVGVDTKAAKKKYVLSDVVQTVPGRLADYENRKAELADLKTRREVDLGRSTLFARLTATKADMKAVRDDLMSDAQGILLDAKTELAKLADVPTPADPPAAAKKIVALDTLTMWTLTLAGAGLMFGLGTRACAVVCGGFLVLTYLTTTPLPWFANPPGTEGNPVFVNKNLIEAFACFALACLPTGRWLGADGLIYALYHNATKPADPLPPAV